MEIACKITNFGYKACNSEEKAQISEPFRMD